MIESIDRALTLFAAAEAGAMGLATVVTVAWARVGYPLYRRRFDATARPRCALVVPCKGVHVRLEENLRALLALDPAPERVVFAVEHEQDPAWAVIQAIVRDDARATVVVAGLATERAQKVHNQLAALDAAGTPDVYVFADADICPRREWMRELVLPLSDPTVTATTGFRWLRPAGDGLGQNALIDANILLYTVFAFSCLLGNVGLWGGATAIRRADFEALGVRARWARASVDDMALSRTIVDHGRRALFVPTCMTESDEVFHRPWDAVRWFERQCMYLKGHFRLTWWAVVLPAWLLVALHVWLPLSLTLGLLTRAPWSAVGREAAVVLLVGDMLRAMVFPAMGAMPRFGWFVATHTVFRTAPLLGLARTLFSNTLVWAGIRYRLARDGTVRSVER